MRSSSTTPAKNYDTLLVLYVTDESTAQWSESVQNTDGSLNQTDCAASEALLTPLRQNIALDCKVSPISVMRIENRLTIYIPLNVTLKTCINDKLMHSLYCTPNIRQTHSRVDSMFTTLYHIRRTTDVALSHSDFALTLLEFLWKFICNDNIITESGERERERERERDDWMRATLH